MKSATRNCGDKGPVTIIGLEGSANKIGIGIVRDGEVITLITLGKAKIHMWKYVWRRRKD